MRFRVITIIGKSGDRYLFEIKVIDTNYGN